MKKKAMIIGGLITLAGFSAAVWNQPVYRCYDIDTKGRLSGLTAVVLTDLHNASYGKDSEKLLKMIKEASPDLIFMVGDMADEKSPEAPVVTFMDKLEGLCPIYYVTGNHEYWMDDTEEVHQMFRDHGVRVLINETVPVYTDYGTISLMGVDDPDSRLDISDRKAMTEFLESTYEPMKMTDYRLLLSHRPEFIDLYMTYKFDLILSGHAHGGQMRIPWLMNGLYSPNQGLFPKYAGGHYRMEDGRDFIVSRGLSFRRKLPRIFNPPEVVVIEFL